MTRYSFSPAALPLLTFLISPAALAQFSAPIQLQQTTTSGVIFHVDHLVMQVDTVQIGSGDYLEVQFPQATGFVSRQQARIPTLATVIALPPNQVQPELEVLAAQWQPLPASFPLAPSPNSPDNEQARSTEGAAPTADEPWPEPFRIDNLGWFRNLRIAHVQIALLRQTAGHLEYLQNATVRISWPVSAEALQPQTEQPAAQTEALYTGAVLNAATAPAFVKPRARVLKKSAVRSGEKYLKIFVPDNGIYKLDGTTLTAQGINLAGVDPGHLRLYNNGGRTLPETPSTSRPDSLIEIPVIIDDGGDGRFDMNDAIYFYGRSVNDWQFAIALQSWQHMTNPYTTENVYWLSWDNRATPAKRLEPIAVGGVAEAPTTRGLSLQYVEREIINPIHSGRDWYGPELSVSQNETFTFRVRAATPQTSARLRIRSIATTAGQFMVSAYWNDNAIGNDNFFGLEPFEGYAYLVARTAEFTVSSNFKPGDNLLNLAFSSPQSFPKLHFDWVELIALDSLIATDGTLAFATQPDTGIRRYQLANLGAGTRLLEISDPVNPRYLTFERQNEVIVFSDTANAVHPRRYFASSNTLTPKKFEMYTTSDLRSPQNRADLIIITPAEFREIAERLANHKRSARRFEVAVVDLKNIIDEFGWGLTDPTAVRDFVAYAFRNWQKPPAYVLLFGDGHYDYRNLADQQKNWLPTYQTTSLAELENREVEAYFTYVSGDDAVMDLAIGRLPVRNVTEAKNVVDKIIHYETGLGNGYWRTLFTMVADDEFGSGGADEDQLFHTVDAEAIAEFYIPNTLNLRKIYLMEYRDVRSASISGIRKPDAQNDLINQFNAGTLIINYVGHGATTVWADERVLVQSEDLQRIQNGERLPFIVAATCDFGRFDSPKEQSFPEELLNAADRGIIGSLTSCRVVFAGSNVEFNKQFYAVMFGANNALRSIGMALVLARINTGNRVNDEKYNILGDPTLVLALPRNVARVAFLAPDSLFALGRTSVTGDFFKQNGERLLEKGTAEIRVFDAPKSTVYTAASHRSVRFILPGNVLFRGVGSIDNGEFNLQFLAPKDITYGGKNARISLYGYGEGWDALGDRTGIPISLRSAILHDDTGPQISVTFDNRASFASDEPIPNNATLTATLGDTISGINITGEIGHKITLTIDGDARAQLDLTGAFVFFENDFLRGQLQTTMPNLSLGRHSAVLKAWDNSNNSSTYAFDFVITDKDRIGLQEVLNYPNPFDAGTTFTFILNHEAEVTLSIFTVAGRLIEKMAGVSGKIGYNQFFWDGRDAEGDRLANGIYLYRLVAKGLVDGEEKRDTFIGKLAVQH